MYRPLRTTWNFYFSHLVHWRRDYFLWTWMTLTVPFRVFKHNAWMPLSCLFYTLFCDCAGSNMRILLGISKIGDAQQFCFLAGFKCSKICGEDPNSDLQSWLSCNPWVSFSKLFQTGFLVPPECKVSVKGQFVSVSKICWLLQLL